MRKKSFRFVWMGLAGAGLLSACADDVAAPGPTPSASRAIVYRSQPGRRLTLPSTAAPSAVVKEFIRERGRDADTLLAAEERYIARTGMTHLRFEQAIDGYRVVGRYLKATVDDRRELVDAIDHLVSAPAGRLETRRVDERHALDAALVHLGYQLATAPVEIGRQGNTARYDRGEVFYAEPAVERVLFVDGAGGLRAGFEVRTWSRDRNLLHHTIVDADGRVASVELRTNTDRYNVFREDPGKGAQVVVDGPGAGNAESPIGWLGGGAQTTINIAGNNANAYLDAKSNNQPDRGGTAVVTGEFLTVADLTVSPSTTDNREVAVQNLFYLNNVIHDILYRHGFTESAGNFQADNFGKGGAGGDPVKAEAQDGGGTDNANFATPADGSSPRMQMYLWSSSVPDHEVVVHSPFVATLEARRAAFGAALTTTGLTGDVVLVNDGAGTPTDACEGAGAGLSGKIALIDRGTCAFVNKVLNAQLAGAVGVIVANNTGGDATFVMGGTNRRIRIPAVMVSQNDGATLKANLAGLNATMRRDAVLPPMIDGDLDADIVFHEYGHGLTWRMIGGMSGPMAGAIGEGASDTVAFLVNGDDRIGEYAFGNPGGVRRFPYSGYPLTYGDVTGQEVHNDGEIYAAAMWRLSELFQANGLTNEDLLTVFVGGMNFTPSTPAFEDMRDGMLASVATPTGDSLVECLIWRAFAQYGVGVGASGTTSAPIVIVESFATPAFCP